MERNTNMQDLPAVKQYWALYCPDKNLEINVLEHNINIPYITDKMLTIFAHLFNRVSHFYIMPNTQF